MIVLCFLIFCWACIIGIKLFKRERDGLFIGKYVNIVTNKGPAEDTMAVEVLEHEASSVFLPLVSVGNSFWRVRQRKRLYIEGLYDYIMFKKKKQKFLYG
jgi:hypothetical protein